MQHLTEDMLIKYLFELTESNRAGIISAHLSDCASCREQLDRLKRRFRPLDLLSREVSVPDELITRMLENVGDRRLRRRVPYVRPAWMAAAAALIVIVGILAMTLRNGLSREKSELAKGVPNGEKLLIDSELKEDLIEQDAVALRSEAPRADLMDSAPEKARRDEKLLKAGKPFESGTLTAGQTHEALDRTLAMGDIQEKPPFAPASAIELVVLPRRDKVQLTIYNSADMTLVREHRSLTMKRGWNWLQFMWANTLIDPTSLALEPLAQKDKIDVQQLVYPARLKDIGRWLIRSEVNGQVPFEITYLTSGLKWRAFYMGTLSEDETTMHLAGHVRVDNNSGEEYENAQTRLIVGKVNVLNEIAQLAKRQYPYGRPGLPASGEEWAELNGRDGRRRNMIDEALIEFDGDSAIEKFDSWYAPKQIKKEGLSEYFLYTIEGTETIPNTWGKRLPSFEADDIPVESLYRYDEGRWGAQPIRFLKFVNDTEHKLGETPLPDGSVKIYGLADSGGHLSYVGGTQVKYIPVDDEVELNLGAARHVKVEPALVDLATANYEYDERGDIAGWDEIHIWKITVTNTRDIPVTVEVFRDFATTYWDIENSGQSGLYEVEDKDTVKFTLQLTEGSKAEFQYILTTYHGTRQEIWTAKSR